MLIETTDLEACLDNDELRVVDCDLVYAPKREGGYDFLSGEANWREAHIPNSIYINVESELSAPHDSLRFMMPSAHQFGDAMAARGIGNDSRVVVYSRGGNFWATRLYLMFREFGFDNVFVLNGAWDKWVAEGRPTTTEVPGWPEARFDAMEPRGLFVGKNAVLEAITDPHACVMSALSPQIHSGARFSPHYGRPGRIKGSTNLYCMDLIDPDSNRFLDNEQLVDKFEQSGALDVERVITYCGGGISATTNAFALQLLGKQSVAVYDGSMTEWGNDLSLPMEID
jgi:thiosulfate/3-mercaptopyruvate sulfurtransferase